MPPREKSSHLWIPGSFLLVAALLSYLAWERRGAYGLMLWPALDCGLVGAAYFGPAGRIFGKRRDGSMAPTQTLLMLPFLLITWMTWYLQVWVSGEDCYNEVAPGLFLGRRARKGELPPEAACVVDLTAEFPKPGYHPDGVDYLCLPTLDAFVSGDEDFAALVEDAASRERVFVHCANGHGRSAAFAAAMLIARKSADSPDAAMKMIHRARPLCALNPVQRALLARFAGRSL